MNVAIEVDDANPALRKAAVKILNGLRERQLGQHRQFLEGRAAISVYITSINIYSLIGLHGINKRFVYCTCVFDTVYCLLNFTFYKFDFTKLYSDYIQYSHNCYAYNRSHMYQ